MGTITYLDIACIFQFGKKIVMFYMKFRNTDLLNYRENKAI